jgi:hypothetical protein
MAPHATTWFRQMSGLLRTHPWLLLAPLPLGYAFERLLRALPAADGSRWAAALARAVGYMLSAAVALSLGGSLLVRFPTLATREVWSPGSVIEYVKHVLLVGLTSLRLVGPDLLLSTSFWGGFGWIDTVLPPALVIVLTTGLAAGLILTGWSIARRRDPRHAAWTVILGVSGTATLAAYAVSTYFLDRNLHGRYLIGLYVATVLAAWTIPFPDDRRPRLALRFMLIAAVVAVHAYALPFVLLRYF